MKITVISPFSFGYIDSLVNELRTFPNVEVDFIQLEKLKFNYSGFHQRLWNFFLKVFLQKNLKLEYQDAQIIKQINNSAASDIILVIRPDKLKKETLLFLKKNTKLLISYYFDAIANIPKMEKMLPFFDKVYSYEKADVKEFGLSFITNFIPSDDYTRHRDSNKLFNISSYDKRFPVLEAVGKQLHEKRHPYQIIVRHKKGLASKFVDVTDNYVPLAETQKMIEEAGILLDIQKNEQQGLSFRVFEALGAGKKLITTNADIINYDFYHPGNIQVINAKDPQIHKDFLNSAYEKIPEAVLSKYRRKTWIKEVFGVGK